MDVKQAVNVAREYLADLFSEEGLMDVGLEEVVFNDAAQEWRITMGFSRPWDRKTILAAINDARPTRSYKVLRIDDETGVVSSITDRLLAASL